MNGFDLGSVLGRMVMQWRQRELNPWAWTYKGLPATCCPLMPVAGFEPASPPGGRLIASQLRMPTSTTPATKGSDGL